MQRLRQKTDAVNAGVSGCSTGLVLGWGTGGWIGGLQSCVLFGAFSYFLDGTSLGGSAEAAACEMRGRRRRPGTTMGATMTKTETTGKKGIRNVLVPALPLNGDYFR
jgi:hypothetical protein